MFDKMLRISRLYDYYGKLLNKKHASIIDLYYNQDYSLSEIAENLNISRQGVHDLLKRAESKLEEFEQKLGLINRLNIYNQSAENILYYLDNIKEFDNNLIIEKIKNEAMTIINSIQEDNSDI